MTARPLISVFDAQNKGAIVDSVSLPTVFTAPIRQDIVHFVHYNMAKNSRQPYAVKKEAGMQHSAESWGPGRAVARIPRVSGSGTHRAGQGAFGNMCRKGRMFNPTKIWRRWHRKINLTQKRHAVASALAASAIPSLVMARGHRINEVPELPLVIDNVSAGKTKDIVAVLKNLGALEDVVKAKSSRKLRRGKGKMRNRRYAMRRGPLLVYDEENENLRHAARNVPGLEILSVHRLNLRLVAPGGTLGRFIIWTKGAFKALDNVFGTYRKKGTEKSGYQLQRPMMSNSDIARIINSNAVQSVVKPANEPSRRNHKNTKNPLKNRVAMHNLNPFDQMRRKMAKLADSKRKAELEKLRAANRGPTASLDKKAKAEKRARKQASKAWLSEVNGAMEKANYVPGEEEEDEEDDMEEEAQ